MSRLPSRYCACALVAGCGDAASEYGRRPGCSGCRPPSRCAWNSSQAASHSASVSASMLPEPDARIGDEIDMAFGGHDELRVAGDAAREALRAGHARCVCGRTEIESAPPTAAAKPAIVVRRMLVSGSAAVIMR